VSKVNPTLLGITAKAGLLLAVLGAAIAFSPRGNPIRPPRPYVGGVDNAAVAHLDNMPSDAPIIRD
jgi:hypothetical protein